MNYGGATQSREVRVGSFSGNPFTGDVLTGVPTLRPTVSMESGRSGQVVVGPLCLGL